MLLTLLQSQTADITGDAAQTAIGTEGAVASVTVAGGDAQLGTATQSTVGAIAVAADATGTAIAIEASVAGVTATANVGQVAIGTQAGVGAITVSADAASLALAQQNASELQTEHGGIESIAIAMQAAMGSLSTRTPAVSGGGSGRRRRVRHPRGSIFAVVQTIEQVEEPQPEPVIIVGRAQAGGWAEMSCAASITASGDASSRMRAAQSADGVRETDMDEILSFAEGMLALVEA